MQLSHKQETFSWFFAAFLMQQKIWIKFWTFWKKDDPQKFCIKENTDSEKKIR